MNDEVAEIKSIAAASDVQGSYFIAELRQMRRNEARPAAMNGNSLRLKLDFAKVDSGHAALKQDMLR